MKLNTARDQHIFFALAYIYPHKTETEILNMMDWAIDRLSTDDSELFNGVEHEDLREETEVS